MSSPIFTAWNTRGKLIDARTASARSPWLKTCLRRFVIFEATVLSGTKSLSKSPPHWAVLAPKISMNPNCIGAGAMSDCGLKRLLLTVESLRPTCMENSCGDGRSDAK